jgi:ribosome-binding protein aMBF1 (putative translation factor)
MSEPMNEPITSDYVEVHFRVPLQNLEKAKKALAHLGAEETTESVSWRDMYPRFDASMALRGARKKEGLTQKQLADLLGIRQAHISEMEHSKRPIGKEMARRLATILRVNYRVFL